MRLTHAPARPRALNVDELAVFADRMIASRDIDPVYPVLKRLIGTRYHHGPWAVLVYVAHYDLGAAIAHLEAAGGPGAHPHEDPWQSVRTSDHRRVLSENGTVRTGVERRTLRTVDAFERHLESVQRLARKHAGAGDDGIVRWLQHGFTGHPEHDWTTLRENAGEAWGNGRWATYKLAEVCKEVLGWPVEAPDMGMLGASGPLDGLEMLLPGTRGKPIVEVERLGRQLAGELSVMLDRRVSVAETETLLCDSHSLASGRYYVGNDIDLMLSGVLREPPAVVELALEARRALPRDYLGELGGWTGVRRHLLTAWRDHGVMVDGRTPGGTVALSYHVSGGL